MPKGQVQTERAMARIGERHGLLVLTEYIGSNKYRRALFKCKCDCGNEVVKDSSSLTRATPSCGCDGRRRQLASVTKHGGSRRLVPRSKLSQVWSGIKRRCYNQKSRDYRWYGAKGVTVCDRWLHDFAAFRSDMEGTYFEGASIDRIDPNGNYEPSNCRWLKHSENCRRAAKDRWMNMSAEESANWISHLHSVRWGKAIDDRLRAERRNGKYRGE